MIVAWLGHMKDEENVEPPPPSPEKVAQRAIVLSTVCCRGFVERDRSNAKEAGALVKRACNWLRGLGLEEELSAWERQVLDAPFGTLPERDRINASWLSEGLVVLAWALGKAELPGVDEQCSPADTANCLGFLEPIDATVLKDPQIRPLSELQEYNEFIYNIHWRVRDFSLNRRRYDFESLAQKAWGEPVLRHGLVLRERDLCVNGVPISQSEESAWRALVSITQERHRASNWLIGYESEDFYLVTTDT